MTAYFGKGLWLLLLVALALVLQGASAQADEAIPPAYGGLGDDQASVAAFLRDHPVLGRYFSASADRAKTGHEFSIDDIRVGRYDVNDDGKPELFLLVTKGVFCGTAGCPAYILTRKRNGWDLLATLYVANQMAGNHDVLFGAWRGMSGKVYDDKIRQYVDVSIPAINKRYRTLYSAYWGVRWTGSAYESFCLARCEDEDG